MLRAIVPAGWKLECEILIRKGEAKRLVAQSFGLYAYQLRKLLSGGYEPKEDLRHDGCSLEFQQLSARREAWLEALAGAKGSRAFARVLNRSLYKYLYTHDRQWLFATENIRQTKTSRRRFDWFMRDEQWLRQLEEAEFDLRMRDEKKRRTSACDRASGWQKCVERGERTNSTS